MVERGIKYECVTWHMAHNRLITLNQSVSTIYFWNGGEKQTEKERISANQCGIMSLAIRYYYNVAKHLPTLLYINLLSMYLSTILRFHLNSIDSPNPNNSNTNCYFEVHRLFVQFSNNVLSLRNIFMDVLYRNGFSFHSSNSAKPSQANT